MQERQTELNKAVTAAVGELQKVMSQQLYVIADDKHLAAVLPLEQAFFIQEKFDLTSEILFRLDDKLDKVELKLEDKSDSKK